MSWEFHPAQAVFAQHAADWDRLNGELYDSHPYFDSRFVGPLLRYFGTGRELLCLFRSHSIIRAALILQSRGGGRWVTFRPAQAQITPLLVTDANLLNDLFAALPGIAWSIEFHDIDPLYTPAFSFTRERMIVSDHYTTIGIQQGAGFEVYWSQRPKKLQSNIRRYANRLYRESVDAKFSLCQSPEALADGVRRFGELESAGWKAAAGTAVSIDNVLGRFYAEVFAVFSTTGQAKIYELTIDGQLAASRLLIGNQSMLVSLKTCYNETFARFAPGWLLLHNVLERQLSEHPERSIESYTSASREQAEWATYSRTVQNIHLFRNDVIMAAYALVRTTKRNPSGTGHAGLITTDEAPGLEVRSCNSLDALTAGADWSDHFSASTSIEESLDWFGLLQQQVYPYDFGIRYYYVANNGRLMGILPLRQSRRGGIRTLESLSNYYTSLYAPLLSRGNDPAALHHILSAAIRDNCSTHVTRMGPMDPDTPIFSEIQNHLRAKGWIPMTFFCFGNWFLKVDGGWEDYLRTRSGNLRSNIKRANRDFTAEKGVLEVVTGPEGLDEAIAAYDEVYAASWKKPEPYPEFVPSLIRLLAAKGMLRLGIAYLHGRPVAAQLWIVGRGKASIYKVAYREDYSKFSPGRVLTSYLMQYVIEQDGVSEVDFLIGDDEYKKVWMSHRRERWGIVAFNSRTIIGCALLAKEVAGRLLKQALGGFRFKLIQAGAVMSAVLNQFSFRGSDQTDSSEIRKE